MLPVAMTNERPLLDWLLARYPDTPKTRAKQWIQAGRVRVGGTVIRQPHRQLPDPGGALHLAHRAAVARWRIHPRVEILYLDAALAVVNKGPGLLSVSARPGELSAQSILADFLAGKLRSRHPVPPPYRRLRPLPVHRLDQYTSGVFCLAMNPVARRQLIAQIQSHTVQREYVAYVEGRPASPTGTWRHWLKLGAAELRQTVVPHSAGARAAVTHYELLETFGAAAKLRLRLATGCKHQIRVQAAHAGLPLIGDRTYNPRGRIPFGRQALHAQTLGLEHPETRRVMTFTAPLPPDLRQLEARLR